MKIANPLYDHAFKYLMSNDRLARKVLSVILEKEVPEEFKDVAEYLQRPLREEDIRARLRIEEEVEELFAIQEAEKEELKKRLEEERRQKEEAQAKAVQSATKLARLLLRGGSPAEAVARETGLTEEEVRRLE